MTNVIVGVTGGIAAYKAADLCSQLLKKSCTVRVMMTRGAAQFVSPLTFEGLTGQPVMVNVLQTGLSADGVSAVEHISWAKWADVVVVAPLTASTLAKIACGIADDALTTVLMATPIDKPVILCPAMNTVMWENPVVQRNLGWIEDLGRFEIIAPTTKRLACGDVGVGGLAEVPDIVRAVLNTNNPLF